MIFELPILRFEQNALEPYISARTMEFHYGQVFHFHVNNVNRLVDEFNFVTASLLSIIQKKSGCPALFYNAAQVWNHAFYFEQLSPTPKIMPGGNLLLEINRSFGSVDEFKNEFDKASLSIFGSGNTWLSQKENGTLIITQELNAENPMTKNCKPLLVCDMWEHAYFIDYQCRRADYLSGFWKILDWDVIEKRFNN
ncbi:MAG: superoxide dismutase [Prevotellaceae bacterium]|jgi:Fe-Mn family superoxide dismutase|nr:superoxide dismutase [Prevotellaceae bacterium]